MTSRGPEITTRTHSRSHLLPGAALVTKAKTIVVGFRPLAASRSVKQLRRGASVSKLPDAQSNPPAVAFAVQMRPGHFVCRFARISGRHEPRVLLLPAATAAKLDLVYVHDHEASVLHVISVAL
jgi:hypothetical protein